MHTIGRVRRWRDIYIVSCSCLIIVLQLLLLSGPAGYGKTTLAHVAACQAGYEIMEINARYNDSCYTFEYNEAQAHI